MLAPRLRGALLLYALSLAAACDKAPSGPGGPNTDLTCQAGKIASAPAAGTVVPNAAGPEICVGGGAAGAQYALVAFYANPDSSQVASINVTAQGATALSTANKVPEEGVTASGQLFTQNGSSFREQFDMHLRTMARATLTPRMVAARAYINRAHRAAFDVIPQTVTDGQILTLNANANDPCDNPIEVGARVVTQTSGTIIAADTSNPAGGFTDADYQSFATMFDTLISPLDVQNFGQPTDIDQNGKILILFTQEVNKLTPRGSAGVVGGFTFERDLFPVNDDPAHGLTGCAGSNFGEMFYVMVPDPNGTVSDPRTKTDVLNLTPATLAHEYQHLINAGRRLYVNDASAFEDTWLNEGLSHIAEELLYYRQSGLAPRQNISINTIGATQTSVNIFNNDQADNLGRYNVFMSKPSKTSVYGGDDSLETRGATWNLLRYLADQHNAGTSDQSTWQSLVNTTFTGQANLAHVFGSNYMTQIRNWATSVFSDDLPGVPPTYQEASWNMRGIFPQLCANSSCTQKIGKFPLAVVPLGDGSPASLSVNAGGVAYMRFSVPANSQATINWSGSGGASVAPGVQFTVVRSQ